MAQSFLFHVMMEFVPVANARDRRAIDRQFAQVFDEPGWLAHERYVYCLPLTVGRQKDSPMPRDSCCALTPTIPLIARHLALAVNARRPTVTRALPALVSPNSREIAGVFFERDHDGVVAGEALFVCTLDASEHALVVLWNDAYEARLEFLPRIEDFLCTRALGVRAMTLDHRTDRGDFFRIAQCFERDHLLVD